MGVSKESIRQTEVAKKIAAKKVHAKSLAASRSPAPDRQMTEIKKRYSKPQIINELATNSGLNRKEIGTVLDELGILVNRHIEEHAAGEFVLAGLFKRTTIKKPSKRARKAVNPFTGKEIVFNAKPPTNAVKVYPLKGLKDMANLLVY